LGYWENVIRSRGGSLHQEKLPPAFLLPERRCAMAKANTPVKPKRMGAAARKQFLAHLAQTANVSASARHAGFADGNAFYTERRRSAEFHAAWVEALAEGYARLEADLLAEALQTADGKISEGLLKARAQKHRLRLSLLNWHQASAKASPALAAPRISKDDLPVLKAQLILKLTHMRERAGIPIEGSNDSSPPLAQDAA
jgi:hypothetical protein